MNRWITAIHADRARRWAVAAGVAALALITTACIPTAGTQRVSVGADGQQGDGSSFAPAMSADGRFVAFVSAARNLGGGADAGTFDDVFVKDRSTGAIERISIDELVPVANGNSGEPVISGDGARVAFSSTASNIGEANANVKDVFVRDRPAGTTTLASLADNGAPGNDDSRAPDISATGRFVVFDSRATNLVTGDANGVADVFLRDLDRRTTRRVSVGTVGSQLPEGGADAAVSADGSRVVYLTKADLSIRDNDQSLDAYVWSRATDASTFVDLDGAAPNQVTDVDISDDGRFVAFVSSAGSSQPQAWVQDLQTGTTVLLSGSSDRRQGNGATTRISITGDGGHVAFDSEATDLVAGDTNGQRDVFVVSRTGGGLTRASVGSGGAQPQGLSRSPAVASGGQLVAFESNASNVVAGDTNGRPDVFVRKR